MKYWAGAILLLGAACGRYRDFTLPVLPGGSAQAAYRFEPDASPVLSPGEGWESRDVLNPSVVRTPKGLLNLYSGFDGHTWHTGIASSTDGVHWHRDVGSSRVDLQACKLEYSIVSPK